jgi:acid phosphatase type 7
MNAGVGRFIQTVQYQFFHYKGTFTRTYKYLLLAFFSLTLIAPLFMKDPLATVSSQASNQLMVTTAGIGGEDTHVSSANPTTNYGQAAVLEIDNDPVKRGLLRFNITGLPGGSVVTNATLRLYVNNFSPIAGVISAVSGSWNESSTTWSGAPTVGAAITTLANPATVGTWLQANVTSRVTGNGVVNFYITSTSIDGVFYHSGENATNPPTLVITYTLARTSTPPPSPSDPILIGAGDISSCANNNDEKTAQLIDAVFASGATGRVVALGDVVYDTGTSAEFTNCYHPTWGRHRSRTSPAVGNHEYLTAGASGYFNYFGSLAGDPTKGYYSYNLGAWHIVVINSNCSRVGGCHIGSPQETWLKADLAANPRTCTLAYWHHPRFSSGRLGNWSSMGPIWQALYNFNADVVLVGHDHIYERFAPQNPSGQLDTQRGIREFVVGTGGKNHASFGTIKPNSQVRNSDTFGVLQLTLHSSSYDWRFIPEPGKTFTDSGSTACH